MTDCITTIRGETLHLLPERALWWPARALLLLSDIHIGKAATMRAHGIPLPRGSSSATLMRLTNLVERLALRHMIFLGDFLHARHSRNDATLSVLRAWRERHPDLHLQLVLGNHDRHAGNLPENLRIEVARDAIALGPFLLRHFPEREPDAYVIAGHLHPAIRVHGLANESARLPCFVIGTDLAILPAFGELTGASVIEPLEDQQIFACADEQVFALPTTSRRS